MPLESVIHISDLVVTNPTSTDPKSEGDNHLRNIKTALKTDFPNISGPVTKTHTQLNNALDKTGDSITGTVLYTGSVAMGYGTGSGGTVTQATSKSTAVTLNKPSGKITLNNANLNANSTVLFTFINSSITSADIVLMTIEAASVSTTASYNVWATASSGAAVVALRNITAGNLAEAVVINFAVIKGATS